LLILWPSRSTKINLLSSVTRWCLPANFLVILCILSYLRHFMIISALRYIRWQYFDWLHIYFTCSFEMGRSIATLFVRFDFDFLNSSFSVYLLSTPTQAVYPLPFMRGSDRALAFQSGPVSHVSREKPPYREKSILLMTCSLCSTVPCTQRAHPSSLISLYFLYSLNISC
jgi:hypothetical protein